MRVLCGKVARGSGAASANLKTVEPLILQRTGLPSMAPGTLNVVLADPYLEGYRELARREGAVLVEDFLGEIPRTAGLTLDGLHPSAEGHRRLADRLLPVLSRLVGHPGSAMTSVVGAVQAGPVFH